MHGAAVYVTGSFSVIGKERRDEYAALDVRTGRLLPWNPRPRATSEHGIYPEIVGATDALLTAGYFDQIGGEQRDYFAALDYVSGHVLPLRIAAKACFFPEFVAAYGKIFFNTLEVENGDDRCRVEAFDARTGLPVQWTPLPHNPPYNEYEPVAAAAGSVYVARFEPGSGFGTWSALVRVDRNGNIAGHILEVKGMVGTVAAAGVRTLLIGGDFTAVRFKPPR